MQNQIPITKRLVLFAALAGLLSLFAARAVSEEAGKGAAASDGSVKIEVAAPEAPETPAASAAPDAKPAPGAKGSPAPQIRPAPPEARRPARPRTPGLFGDVDEFGDDPFDMMRRMQEDMDRLFEENFRSLGRARRGGPGAPPAAGFGGFQASGDMKVDMREEGGDLKILCALPGVDKKSIQVRIQDNLLTVTAERNANVEEKGDNYYRREISVGSVSRTLPLPVPVDETRAKAKYDAGLLTITVPKRAEAAPDPHTIEVE